VAPRASARDFPTSTTSQQQETFMADTSLDLDNTALGAGPVAGFLQWHAMGGGHGLIPPETFTVRSRDSTGAFDLKRGFVANWVDSQTGWMRRENAIVTERLWNQTRTKFLPYPGQGWKRAMRIALLIDDRRFVWEQDTVGAMRGLLGIFALMRGAGAWAADECPCLAHVGSVPDLDGNTLVPTFELRGRITRPAVFDTPLPEPAPRKGNGKGEASGYRERAQGSRGQSWDAPAGDSLPDDEIPF
jgi:hypothetical protein